MDPTEKTQVVPVEMIAPILALETFKERLIGADVIILIDSEAVEAALIKGYSSKEDLCDLISVFWDLVFEIKARVFIDRVATDANPADWPSRGDLVRGEKAAWIFQEGCVAGRARRLNFEIRPIGAWVVKRRDWVWMIMHGGSPHVGF